MVGERLVKGAVFLALIVLATGCRHKDEPLKPLVIVDKPEKEDVQIFGEYVGRIRAARFVEIHARVEGYLEKMLFVEGKEVKQNEPLFIINSALYKAKVEKAKAQLKKNEAQAAKAKRDVERLQPLYEQHAASQLDLDNALASLGDAEADIAMSKADLDQAQLELSYTTVTSPLAGYISERFVDVGALVGPGVNSKLAAVVKSDTVLVDFKMTALDYLRAERRNIKFGEQDTSRSWQPTVTVTLAFYYDLFIFTQSTFYNNVISDFRPSLHKTLFCYIIPADYINESSSFLYGNSLTGNNNRTFTDIQQEFHFCELPREKFLVRIGKFSTHPECSSLRINNRIRPNLN